MFDEDKVREYFTFEHVTGEVGIEIEVEGRRLPTKLDKWWLVKNDGSLRGNGREYVCAAPIKRDEVSTAIEHLHQAFIKSDTKLNLSSRCGVHVHVNMQSETFKTVINLITLYTIFEDLLVKYCGTDREGNLFCLRMSDVEYFVDTIAQSVRDCRPYFVDREYKYAALNLGALSKFGSVEFRSLRTPADFGEIITWIQMLLKLKDAAQQFDKTVDIMASISAKGGRVFMGEILGEFSELIETPGTDAMLTEGMRRAQIIAYSSPKKKKKKVSKEKKKRDRGGQINAGLRIDPPEPPPMYGFERRNANVFARPEPMPGNVEFFDEEPDGVNIMNNLDAEIERERRDAEIERQLRDARIERQLRRERG